MVSHVDPDLVALRALGAELPDDAREHLAGCSYCAAEVRSLVEVVELGRSLRDDSGLVEPPPHVWSGIAAATGWVGGSNGPARLEQGRWSGPRIAWTLAAAITGVLAGAGAVVGWQGISGDGGAGDPALVAQAVLDPLPDRAATGVARVVTDPEERRLVISLDSTDSFDGYLVVWLLTPDVSGMVSLGVLAGDTAELAIPDGLDLETFSVVDVSVEPFDGDPTHSGNSLVRGELDDV